MVLSKLDWGFKVIGKRAYLIHGLYQHALLVDRFALNQGRPPARDNLEYLKLSKIEGNQSIEPSTSSIHLQSYAGRQER